MTTGIISAVDGGVDWGAREALELLKSSVNQSWSVWSAVGCRCRAASQPERRELLVDVMCCVGEEKVKYAIASFQGSTADIIKIAMINIHSLIVGEVNDSDVATVVAKFHMLRGHCRILL
ncbi:hypothetical protein RHMOL_Rhmol08G0119700 [Rhododendron molle]|uniref:Uncharacterized protein n=1 Tax=Rhododendron molle TaxID=49168 RepID=A0ACC0MPH9_RHOML|nr:hypothetical protein RHMOL_Rhmol08G0119700 [Rhododendron molle]